MSVVAIRNISVVDQEPDAATWTQLPYWQSSSAKALRFILSSGRPIWIAKKHLIVFAGNYYAKNWTLQNKDTTH